MEQSILKINGVSKVYSLSRKIAKSKSLAFSEMGNIKAVDKACLELRKGEIFGLLGPNGAGKSTILKMVCGLISPTEGDITLDGQPISVKDYKAKKDIGALIELPVFLEKLSGEYNLKFLASLSGNVSEKRIQEMCQIFEMESYIKNPVLSYSLGMRQKLGIVQAIMNRPKLLILDEPTNGLDPKWVAEMRQLLKRLAKEYGITILISSHVLAEMQEICDRVAIMNKGKILSVGTVEDMMTKLGDGKNIVDIKVDNTAKALEVCKEFSQEFMINGDILTVKLPKDKLPLLTKELVVNNVMLGGVSVRQQKLEDVFRNITEQKQGADIFGDVISDDNGGNNG